MLIFISAYVLLALASWSALAAPLSGSEPDNGNAQKHSLSSSILTGRQQPSPDEIGPITPVGFGLVSPPGNSGPPSQSSTTMDCDDDKHKHHDKTDNDQNSASPTIANMNLEPTPTGPGPAIARRRFRSPTRRDRKPSIFERDDAPTTGASTPPITVGDIINHYLGQRAAARKRAQSPRTSRDFN
ncbi:hypothetical protein F5888DRAFT_539797 [Russula emetica]|nr:hypothetical protein F5888DRAFT_539797 [Russula emetica]